MHAFVEREGMRDARAAERRFAVGGIGLGEVAEEFRPGRVLAATRQWKTRYRRCCFSNLAVPFRYPAVLQVMPSLTRRDAIISMLGAAAGAASLSSSGAAQTTASPSTPSPTSRFFPGFKSFRIQTSEAAINGFVAGSGSPVLLLHGWPQTCLEWQVVAPLLAKNHTVVATDLRGYGDSSRPADGRNHEGYSKRSMARDQVEAMHQLGFDRFAVVGHDRGGRVGHRMALDHSSKVTKLAVLDIIPTHTIYHNVTQQFATAYFHWFFLIQPAPLPETLLLNSAEFFLRGRFGASRVPGEPFQSLIPSAISEATFAEYLRNFRDPASLHAMCEDYRAGASIDLEHDDADLTTKIDCPFLVLWGANNPSVARYDVIATWKERAAQVAGKALPGGHWLPEQLPNEVYAELQSFLG